jgi:hypothetical protein
MNASPVFHAGLTKQMCLAAEDIYVSEPWGSHLIGALMREGEDFVVYASMPFRYFGTYKPDELRDGLVALKAANGGGHG